LIFSKHILNNYLPKLLFLSLLASTVFAYSGGTGQPNDPYQIADINDLLALAAAPADYNKCFILTADIDMAGQAFTKAIIAADTSLRDSFQGTAFTGTFDGKGHKITHLTINGGFNDYIGLFGCINGGSVKNLGLDNFSVSGRDYLSGLIGYDYNSSITNSCSTGTVSGASNSQYVGGLVGYSDYYSSLSNCHSTGIVSGYSCVGGLAGVNSGSITDCYSTDAVSNSFPWAAAIGGLVGSNYDGGNITNSYSTGTVRGSDSSDNVGGLAGCNIFGSITNSYSTGVVSSHLHVGGLIGYSNSGITNNSFWDVNTSGQTTSVGGTGKTTAQMKTLSTFTDAGWDFSYTDGNEAVWFMPINEYPILTWQISPADIYTDGRNNFRDFAVLARYWMRDDCRMYNHFCDWADLNFDGIVDIRDLKEFASYWLQSGIYAVISAPGHASNPTPLNGDVDVALAQDLSWTAGRYAASHDVYFGTVNPPPFAGNLTDTTYDTGVMAAAATYYWRIDEINGGGTTTGTVWSFTVTDKPMPSVAVNPFPVNGDKCSDPNGVLSWSAGPYTDSYDVYLGTDFNNISNADTSSPEFMGDQIALSYDPCNLDVNTTYYWRIDSINPYGFAKGNTWQFKTWLEPNLILWWKFDENSGNVAYDSSANGHNATIVGAQWTANGKINEALDFDGTNDFVDYGGAVKFEDKDFSVSFWFKTEGPHSDGGYGVIAGKYDVWYIKQWLFQQSPDGKINFATYDSYQNGEGLVSTVGYQNQWVHCVGVRKGPKKYLYINGILDGNAPCHGVYSESINSFLVGAINSGFNQFFNGKIDDVRIYNRALSDSEIQQIYQQGSTP